MTRGNRHVVLILLTLAPAALAHAPADLDRDGDVDQEDFGHLQVCLTGYQVRLTDPACLDTDLDGDGYVSTSDVSIFVLYFNGADKTPKSP